MQLEDEVQPNRRIYSKLTALRSGRLDRAEQPDRLPRVPASRFAEQRREAVLGAIDQTQRAFGDAALTDGEHILWNTGLLLSTFTGHLPDIFDRSAKVRSWSAARRGFICMGLPCAAEHIVVLVKELAYRSERPGRNDDDEAASLLRLAELKRRFHENSAERDPLAMFDALIEQIYPWPD